LVIWPVKIIPEMTYDVLSGMLSLHITTTTALCDNDIHVYSSMFLS